MSGEIPIQATMEPSLEAARVIPLEYAPPSTEPRPLWRTTATWAISLGWICCVVAWLLIVAVNVESVVGTGPILFVIGIACAVAGYKLRSAWPLIIGVSHCAICLLFVVMVNAWNLSPRRAYVPFTIVGAMYCIVSAIPTWFALFWPKFDARAYIPGLREADFVQDLSEPLRMLLGYEMLHGNVVERIERNRWSRCPLAVVLRHPLRMDQAAQEVQVPVTIRRWENRDPRYEPQSGWVCSITLQSLGGPIAPRDL